CGTLGASLKSGGIQPFVPSPNLANRPYPSQIYARYLLHRASAKRSRACSTPTCRGGSNATSFSTQRSTGSALNSPLRTICVGFSTIRFPRHNHIFVSWPGLKSGRHLMAFRILPYSLWRNSLVSTVEHTTSLLHSWRIALSPFTLLTHHNRVDVTQVSVLSPILFNIVLAGLSSRLGEVPDLEHPIYADDITLWTHSGSPGYQQDTIQAGLDIAHNYV
ncbi:hypothetical protein IscW_ISCW001163, partial [Ixodes scapularis]